MSDLGTHRWSKTRDRPRQRPSAAGTGGGDQNTRLVAHQVGDGKAIPGAPAPLQVPRAHDREAKVDGRERMSHDDVAGPIQRKVALRCKFGNRLVDLGVVQRGQVPDLVPTRWVALAGERVIDGPAHTLDKVLVHGFST
jgi:hypothetical protein